jgi:hypothetical protein
MLVPIAAWGTGGHTDLVIALTLLGCVCCAALWLPPHRELVVIVNWKQQSLTLLG